jgi:hypothetical protein
MIASLGKRKGCSSLRIDRGRFMNIPQFNASIDPGVIGVDLYVAYQF